jgi:hypothetical protein
MNLRIFLTICALVVVGAMLIDQLRLRGMTPLKWAMIPTLLALLIVPIWITP